MYMTVYFSYLKMFCLKTTRLTLSSLEQKNQSSCVGNLLRAALNQKSRLQFPHFPNGFDFWKSNHLYGPFDLTGKFWNLNGQLTI